MFDYDKAFSRNIGWVTKQEQQTIKNTKIAIGGLGGAGGEHALALARMGFENFHLSDFDEFEVHNFNRQAGAFMSTVDKPKCNVMASMIRDINPNAKITEFPDGLNESNIDAFFDGVSVYVDGIDFFALKARKLVYQAAQDRGIPNLLAAPLGFGVSLICFTKDSMKFDEYYRFSESKTEEESFIKLLIGLSPALLHTKYLADPSAANFKEQRGPSTPMAIKLCSGLLCSNVVKLVLGRGKVVTAPRVLQFDAYRDKFVTSWCPFGNAGPIQKIKFAVAKKTVS
uniref:ThiF family adenylyltransferase n=1 Tax=Ningiella ruwaisensis TaxID=2364274 RepID=UPI00109F2CFD|nr:ThiF family adenylyltransferase [Ningiella ruwaisensis]